MRDDKYYRNLGLFSGVVGVLSYAVAFFISPALAMGVLASFLTAGIIEANKDARERCGEKEKEVEKEKLVCPVCGDADNSFTYCVKCGKLALPSDEEKVRPARLGRFTVDGRQYKRKKKGED